MSIQEQLRAAGINSDIFVRHAFVSARAYVGLPLPMGGVKIESSGKLKSYAEAVRWLEDFLPTTAKEK